MWECLVNVLPAADLFVELVEASEHAADSIDAGYGSRERQLELLQHIQNILVHHWTGISIKALV